MAANYINPDLYDSEIVRRYQQMVPILKDKLEKTLRLYSNMVRQHAECHEGDVFRLDTSEYTRHLADVVRHLDEMQLLLSVISAWGSLPVECMAGRSATTPGGGLDTNIDFNVLEAEGRNQLERMMSVQNILQKCRPPPPPVPPQDSFPPSGPKDGDDSQLRSMISSEEDLDEQSLLGKPEAMDGLDAEDLPIMSLDTTLKELAEVDGTVIGLGDNVMEGGGGVGELLDDDLSLSPPAVVSSIPPPMNPASVPVASMQTPPPPPPPRPSTASERISSTSQPIRPASMDRGLWFRPKDEPRSSRPSSVESSGGVLKQEEAAGNETPLESLLRSRSGLSPADTFSGTGSGSRPGSVSTPSFVSSHSQGHSHQMFMQQPHKSPSPQQYLQHQQLTPQQQEQHQQELYQTPETQQQQSQQQQPQPSQQQQQMLQQRHQQDDEKQRSQHLHQYHAHTQQQMASQFEHQQESFKLEPTSVKMETIDEDTAFGGSTT